MKIFALYNKLQQRDITVQLLTELQERELAEQYREWSKVAEKWPRTSMMLKTIASRWDYRADQEDLETKKEMMKN